MTGFPEGMREDPVRSRTTSSPDRATAAGFDRRASWAAIAADLPVSAPDAITADDAALLALADRLTAQAGRGRAAHADAARRRPNNQVYRVDTEGGAAAGAETLFQRSARHAATGSAPNGISSTTPGRAASAPCPSRWPAMPTRRPGFTASCRAASSPHPNSTPAHIDAAIDFVLAVNAAPAPGDLAPGSEACFSPRRSYRHRRAPRCAARDARSGRAACRRGAAPGVGTSCCRPGPR